MSLQQTVYLLRSIPAAGTNRETYLGFTTIGAEKRLANHNNKTVSSTKAYVPWDLAAWAENLKQGHRLETMTKDPVATDHTNLFMVNARSTLPEAERKAFDDARELLTNTQFRAIKLMIVLGLPEFAQDEKSEAISLHLVVNIPPLFMPKLPAHVKLHNHACKWVEVPKKRKLPTDGLNQSDDEKLKRPKLNVKEMASAYLTSTRAFVDSLEHETDSKIQTLGKTLLNTASAISHALTSESKPAG